MSARETEIVIRLRLPRWPAKRWLVIAAALVVGGSAVAFAVVPSFTQGATLNAADLNKLVDAVNKSITAQGLYCGVTAATNGNISAGTVKGYPAVKKQCELTCNSPSAHICTAQELLANAEKGWTPTTDGYFWYATGTLGYYQSTYIWDCAGFQNATHMYLGSAWYRDTASGANTPDDDYCDQMHPILCCD
jgi:hypothetical protein